MHIAVKPAALNRRPDDAELDYGEALDIKALYGGRVSLQPRADSLCVKAVADFLKTRRITTEDVNRHPERAGIL